jgi:predicted ATPase
VKDTLAGNRLFILTGGPGSGKTVLKDALASKGLKGSTEAGRAIIKDQIEIGGHALPWLNPLAFAELMLSWEMRSYRWAQNIGEPVIFDRGIPDVIGYLCFMKLPIPEHMEKAARIFRYNRKVFIAPPWPEIFHTDSERKQTFDEARATYNALVETYPAYDYTLIPLPLVSVEERVQFVISHIK